MQNNQNTNINCNNSIKNQVDSNPIDINGPLDFSQSQGNILLKSEVPSNIESFSIYNLLFPGKSSYTHANKYQSDSPMGGYAILQVDENTQLDEYQKLALDTYAAQASLCQGFEYSVFCYELYKKKKIHFIAFFIMNIFYRERVEGIVIFDTIDSTKSQFQHRCTWWKPGVLDKANNPERWVEKSISANLKLNFTFSKKHLYYYADDSHLSTITSQNNNNDDANIVSILAKTRKIYLEELYNETDGLDAFCVYAPLCNKNDLPPEDLIADDGPLNCRLYYTQEPSSNLKMIFEKHAQYLKSEQGYDFVQYNSKYDVDCLFFFLVDKNDLCIGSFIFSKEGQGYSDVLPKCIEELEAFCESYEENKQAVQSQPSEVYGFFKKKNLELKEKLKKLESSLKPIEFTGLPRRKSDEEWELIRDFCAWSRLRFMMGLTPASQLVVKEKKQNYPRLKNIWIHPYFRRQGLLQFTWPKLREELGIFSIDNPSVAMRKFLDNVEQSNVLDERLESPLCG